MSLRTSKSRELTKHLLLLCVLAFAFFPLYLMLVISFKDNNQFARNPWFFDPVRTWKWGNWSHGWLTVRDYIANSVVVSVSAVVIGLVMVVLTSYALARYRFVGRSVIYYGLVILMFLPASAATLVTLFTLLDRLNLVNSLLALILVGAAGAQIVGVFILKQFIEDIPKELFEAAEIDGAGHLQQIRHVVLPMSGSVLATLAILTFLGLWNELMLPLVLMRDEKLTIPVGLMRLEGEYVKEWGQLMAGYAISAVPLVLLFLFTMRLFVKGLSAAAR